MPRGTKQAAGLLTALLNFASPRVISRMILTSSFFFQARWPPKHSKLLKRLKSPRPGWDFQVEEKRWGFNRTPLSQPVLCPETWANSLHVATVGFRQGTQPSAPIWKQKTEKCQNKPTSPVAIVRYWWCSAAKSSLTLWAHGLQHAGLFCPSLSPRVSSNSYPFSWWCYLTTRLWKQSPVKVKIERNRKEIYL